MSISKIYNDEVACKMPTTMKFTYFLKSNGPYNFYKELQECLLVSSLAFDFNH